MIPLRYDIPDGIRRWQPPARTNDKEGRLDVPDISDAMIWQVAAALFAVEHPAADWDTHCREVRSAVQVDLDRAEVAIAVVLRVCHYYSTACFHGDEPGREHLHAECDIDDVRWDGSPKTAATCKYCPKTCGCPHHAGSAAADHTPGAAADPVGHIHQGGCATRAEATQGKAERGGPPVPLATQPPVG